MQHVTWPDARALLHAQGSAQRAKTEDLPLDRAIGRVLASALHTPLPVPHYDSSAMDGYAVAGPSPWLLRRSGGAQPTENVHRLTVDLHPGTATPILTGGLLPAGADAVLRLEHAELLDKSGQTYVQPLPHFFAGQPLGQPAPGADIRRTGEELPQGSPVLDAGVRLTARHIGSLATLGFDTLPVLARPTLALAFTGNEIIIEGLPAPGQVRDAFSPHFPHIIEHFGAQVTSTARLHDDTGEFRTWFAETQADILMLTGGSSTSDVDWVRRTLAELDATYLFESVAVRPGHPALAALLPDGRICLGLPGNPLAAHVALYSYLPALLAGVYAQPLPQLSNGTLTAAVPGYRKKDLRLVPVTAQPTATGTGLTPHERTRSHMLTGFATANALAIVPPEGKAAGETCQYLPLPL